MQWWQIVFPASQPPLDGKFRIAFVHRALEENAHARHGLQISYYCAPHAVGNRFALALQGVNRRNESVSE